MYFRDKDETEIGGFGIAEPDDLLFVKEFLTVEQEVTCVSVRFNDEAVGQYFDEQVDRGRKPEQFARCWCHTHPGMSPHPSSVDEETFQRVFGNCQWAVMFVLASDGRTYARVGFNVGPGGRILIATTVDYSQKFGPSDHKAWDAEYAANVNAVDPPIDLVEDNDVEAEDVCDGSTVPYDMLDELGAMDQVGHRLPLDEFAERPDLRDEEEEVFL